MIKTIVTPDTNKVSFDVPDNYLGKKIEVTAFDLDEGVQPASQKTMAEFWGIISKERAEEWNADIAKSKEEWDRNT